MKQTTLKTNHDQERKIPIRNNKDRRSTMKIAIKSILPLFLMTILSVSCGSSGDGTVASGGIGGTGISQGTITGFGSIIRDEDTFNTDDGYTITAETEAAE